MLHCLWRRVGTKARGAGRASAMIVAVLAAGCPAGPAPAPSDSASAGPTVQPVRTAQMSVPAPDTATALTTATASASAAAGPRPEEISTEVPCGAKGPDSWPLTNPALGAWGEDPRTAPDFGYTQERRAPKMPDGGNYLSRIPARTAPELDNALLICHVELYSRGGNSPLFYGYKLGKPNASRPRCLGDWDTFGPPDPLLKLRLREEHPIALFGPEDHWGFFISVPRLRLAQGDLLEVKLWDRDSIADGAGPNEQDTEYVGYASMRLTGKWPIRLSGPYFTMRCNAMSGAEAERSVKSWLAPLDAKLRRLEEWKPDPRARDFGERGGSFDLGQFSFGKGNFRYVAGFLGWDHPTVIDRRAKVERITQVDWPRKRSEAAKLMATTAPAPGKSMALGAANGTLRATGVVCDGGQCTVTLELGGGRVRPSSPEWKVELATVSEKGAFSTAIMVPEGDIPDNPAAAVSYRLAADPGEVVLWIKSDAGVHTVKLRDPG